MSVAYMYEPLYIQYNLLILAIQCVLYNVIQLFKYQYYIKIYCKLIKIHNYSI